MLTHDELMTRARGPIKEIHIGEWDAVVYVRKLSAGDLMRLRTITAESNGDDLAITSEMLSMALCDEQGRRLFSIEDIKDWDGTQTGVLNGLITEVQLHNRMNQAATEELEKNSESGPTSEAT